MVRRGLGVNVLKPHLRITLATLLGQNHSQREIERVTGIDRKTIRAYQRAGLLADSNSPGVATGDDQIPPPRPPTGSATSRCESHREFIEAQLRLRRNATAIYQDLVDRFGFDGAYNSVKRFVAKIRIVEPRQFDRLEFAPGEEAQVDYGEGALTRVAGTQRYRRPRLFVMTLSYSRKSFRAVVWSSNKKVWAQLHEQAFRYFGGAPQYVVLDNLKEGVLSPDLYEPQINPTYQSMLAHYGVVADPARIRDPNRKGRVENAIGHTQATALKGRRFESLEEQNAFLMHWEQKWAASRIHGSAKRQVTALFEEERPHLKPLPLLPIQYFSEVERTVCDDGCVRVDHSSYAARPAVIGTKVMVRIFDHHLEIRNLRTQELLRTHHRALRAGSLVLPQSERVFNPSRETQALFRQAKEIGPAAQALCELLFTQQGRVGQRQLWGIVGLAKNCPRRLLNQACQYALDNGIHSYRHIKAIANGLVTKHLAVLDCEEPTNNRLIQEDPLIRPLQHYGELFAQAANPVTAAVTNSKTSTTTP
jgi:transposase